MKRVLIANRGEIAVRVIRACQDHGLESVSIYSDEDRNSLHAQMATYSYALGATAPVSTYLNIPRIIEVAKQSGADAVHPGYGFLSENAIFAQSVIDAGLIWIGPPPSAIKALGDKVSARKIAAKAGAPLVAGTADPVDNAEEIIAFAKEHGLPVAIKAAHGGGGRGLKIAHTFEEIPEAFASAVREAIAGFGRGECFVERYLEKPRHVETQLLVDKSGHAVVVSTRDCSLQRRHQKLVEEAPAPFLTEGQIEELYRSSKAIMKEVGYVGAGTCEFLIGADGTISFLEVNTRLQVEHTVSEEVTGIDLVRQQFRIAMGEELGFDDPEIRAHSFEFRINGEDPGRSFLPAPGRITQWQIPTGPGVRVDAGFKNGDTIGGNFDSLLAKLIVTGATREEAVQRSRRALSEFKVGGLATALPFHRAIMEDPAFTENFTIHTSYIENEFTNEIPPFAQSALESQTHAASEHLVTEINGKRFEIFVHAPEPVHKRHRAKQGASGTSTGTALTSPMQGTVVKIAVEEGQIVEAGELIIVLEAMKMEQPLIAHRSGVISNLSAVIGETLSSGSTLCDIIDA
ncbi:acetyl-/propionyl-CoA carboxylase subunit alpha [Actinomycetes bacterium]|nr:acetyl-/propionyl-CoA carboxylase subunit alpha [Actinomycetes bacterium]